MPYTGMIIAYYNWYVLMPETFKCGAQKGEIYLNYSVLK